MKIYSEKSKTKICYFCCKTVLNINNSFKSLTKKHYACEDCAKIHLRECSECGKKEFYSFMHTVAHSKNLICGICLDAKYHYCRICRRIFKTNDLIKKYDEYFCISCHDKTFVKCHKCKKEIIGFKEPIRYGTDFYSYCDKCFHKSFGICVECNGTYRIREGEYENGEFICNRCLSRRDSVVYEYNYLPELKFLCNKKEMLNIKTKNNILFMGMELEVGKTKYKVNKHPKEFLKFLKRIGVYDYYFLKKDSSISAFEIVSHPFSLIFAKESMRIDKIVKWLIKEDYNLSNCGFHVHLDRKFFLESDIIKMRIFFSRFKDKLFLISGRDDPVNEYCLYEKYSLKTLYSLTNQKGRHCAFNINTRKNTVEIRIFKGTFDYDLILSYLEFCQYLSEFVKINPLEFISQEEKNKVWLAFTNASKKYINFYNLLKQKDLIRCV
jgi:hypothetical protein